MDILKEYLPDNSVAYIKEILVKYDIEIKRIIGYSIMSILPLTYLFN